MVKHAQDDQTVDIEEVINHNAKTQTVGYIRVSSVDQNTERQLVGLKLDKVFTDKISGAKKIDRHWMNSLSTCAKVIRYWFIVWIAWRVTWKT